MIGSVETMLSLHSERVGSPGRAREESCKEEYADLLPTKRINTITFSAGGAKGVVYAGAIEALFDCGVMRDVKDLYGASIGSMTAAFLAAGMEKQTIIGILKDRSIASELGLERSFYNSSNQLADYVNSKICESIRKKLQDINENISLRSEILDVQDIRDKVDRGWEEITFNDLQRLHTSFPRHFKNPHITAARVNGKKVVFNYENTPEMPISEAVRASTALPGKISRAKCSYKRVGNANIFKEGYYLEMKEDGELQIKSFTGGERLYDRYIKICHSCRLLSNQYNRQDFTDIKLPELTLQSDGIEYPNITFSDIRYLNLEIEEEFCDGGLVEKYEHLGSSHKDDGSAINHLVLLFDDSTGAAKKIQIDRLYPKKMGPSGLYQEKMGPCERYVRDHGPYLFTGYRGPRSTEVREDAWKQVAAFYRHHPDNVVFLRTGNISSSNFKLKGLSTKQRDSLILEARNNTIKVIKKICGKHKPTIEPQVRGMSGPGGL